jgi:ribosomal protein S18 acetylase RimI-like enzyme
MAVDGIAITQVDSSNRPWIRAFLRERWGSDRMVAHGQVYYPAELPGFLAMVDGEPTGVLTYEIVGSECEVVFIDSGPKGTGLGSALVDAVKESATAAGCTRLWLVTTNDNLDALRFYQRRGFVLAALRSNALEEARRLKPEIPLVGAFGIPLRDELELEMRLPSERG